LSVLFGTALEFAFDDVLITSCVTLLPGTPKIDFDEPLVIELDCCPGAGLGRGVVTELAFWSGTTLDNALTLGRNSPLPTLLPVTPKYELDELLVIELDCCSRSGLGRGVVTELALWSGTTLEKAFMFGRTSLLRALLKFGVEDELEIGLESTFLSIPWAASSLSWRGLEAALGVPFVICWETTASFESGLKADGRIEIGFDIASDTASGDES